MRPSGERHSNRQDSDGSRRSTRNEMRSSEPSRHALEDLRMRSSNSASLRRSTSANNLRSNRDIEFVYDVRPSEMEYPLWWTTQTLVKNFRELPECTCWNCLVCAGALAGVVCAIVDYTQPFADLVYNIMYALHVFATCYKVTSEEGTLSYGQIAGFLLDLTSFAHYVNRNSGFLIFCYYIRLHRPFRYLFSLIEFNLKGSVCGTTAKYCYIFLVLRITWAFIWLHLDQMEVAISPIKLQDRTFVDATKQHRSDDRPKQFLSALYLVNKMFIPIGPSEPPKNDIERVVCLLVMLTGSLVVSGAAVASLSLVISLYMRPEETFRARYRLIIKDMIESRVPFSQRDKVETFYKMYWHKQRAVSATRLLPTFPPTLPATIYTDIYFEATQKSRILKNLSYEFLSELAKTMETIHYIPGDAIIERSSSKSSIIYITYGDVEMVTPEDDLTAILRLTRGSILTPCGAATPGGFGRAHLKVRAATFCTAHVLKAQDLWRIAVKYGRDNEQSATILDSFNTHIERVRKHHSMKIREDTKYLSSILHFKRCLVALKEAKNSSGKPLMSRTDYFLEIAGCYLMRNRADSSLTDEADPICLRPTFPCILQPTSSLQFAWHALVACITIAVCFAHPYYLVYKKSVPIEFRFFDYMVTAVYVLDLIVHLSTGDNVEEGVPITFSQTSSQQMQSPWFMVDLAATLPIFELVGTGHFAGINKILKIAKVFRFLKEVEAICVYRSNVVRFLSYTLLLMIACYLIAALQQGFMCFKFGYCLVSNLTHPPYWLHEPLDEDTVENRLTFGLYWAISMIMFTTHRETWGTENWVNVLYTMLILEMCIVIRMFIEAVYSATIMVTTCLREDYDASISIVKSFLIRNQVDPILRQRFITYLQLCWFTDKAYSMTSKRNIFYDLPSHVYQNIVAKQRSKYLLSIPFMKYLHKEDLKNISSKARLFYTSPNEILLNTGDISNEIYVIKQGICESIHPDTKMTVNYLSVKNHFGMLVCLLRIPSFYTIRAVTHVQVFSISRKYLMQAIEVPHIKDAIEFAKQQPEYRRLNRRRASFLSYVAQAPAPSMERFRLPRKHETDHDFLNPFYRLGIFSILRYIFPRFAFRPDGRYIITYECLRAVCALTSAVVYPAYSYLVLQWPWLYFLAWLLDLSAYYDIFQRMLVGYFTPQGILVYHPASTAAYYLKGAFITDLFGALPLENLEAVQTDTDNRFRMSTMKQFLMLNRLIQLYRLPCAMHILQGSIERRDVLIILKAMPLFMILLNVLTCFVVLYSVDIFYKKEGDWQIVPRKDAGGSWIDLFQHEFRFKLTATPWNLHLACYFWVIYETTSTGFNIFDPSNVQLMQVFLVGMLSGAMITTYFLVRIISIRANVNKALAEFQEHMKDMVVYMKRERLSHKLQKEVLEYYEYSWDKMGGVDYRQVFKLCDQISLRTDAILHIYGPTFAKCPILSLSDTSLLRAVGRAVRSGYFLRGMSIVEASDVIADMYFVDYGGVKVRSTKGDTSTFVNLSRGSVFGNLDGAANIRCPVTVLATSKVHLLMINAQVFHRIISDFPIVLKLMEKYRPYLNSSYIMGNVTDALVLGRSTSSPMIVRSRKGLIKYLYFKDSLIHMYLIVVSLLCVYADVYNAGFQDNRFWLITTLYALDLCFSVKILLHSSLSLIVDSKAVKNVLNHRRKEYLQEELKFDVLSILPLELLSFFNQPNRWMLFSWLRLNRMLRIITVYKCLKRHNERITINLILSTITSVFIWSTLFVHTISCMWHFIGAMQDYAQPGSSWVHKDNGEPWCDNYYLCSVYFVLTTFTQNGVGDIMPKNHSEVLFVCWLQIISTMVYMIYVGEFSNIIQYQSFRSFSFYTKYLELQEFLRNNRVSRNLVKMVNKYCLHLWRESRGMQAPHFLHTAPHALRLRVMSAAYLHHLSRHHIFEKCEPAFLRQLVGCLQIFTYNENMFVVKAGEITDAMYVIHTGLVKEIIEASELVARVYPAGSSFGVVQGLFHGTPYNHSYQTITKSQVLTLRLDDWIYLLKHFPDSREAINKHMGRDDDSGGGGSDKSNDGWPFFNPKPPNPTVTEVVDRSTQPSPPTSEKEPLLNKSMTSIFIPPLELIPRDSRLDSVELKSFQTDLWPEDSRHRDSNRSSIGQVDKNKSSLDLTNTQREDNSQSPPSLKGESSSAEPAVYRSNRSHRDLLLADEEQSTSAYVEKIDEKISSLDKLPELTTDLVSRKNITETEEEKKISFDLKPRSSIMKSVLNIDEDEKQISDTDIETRSEYRERHGENQATSTARLHRRFIHVRYEEDKEAHDDKSQSENAELQGDKPQEPTVDERNLLTLDSDMCESSSTSHSSKENVHTPDEKKVTKPKPSLSLALKLVDKSNTDSENNLSDTENNKKPPKK